MSSKKQIRAKIFLCKEFSILAWNASVQHSGIYKDANNNAIKMKRVEFRKLLINYVRRNILPQYSKSNIKPKIHIDNIEKLRSKGTELGSEVLKEEYKIGVAQKFLNLTLKYHWCMGWIEEPPHCPVDRIILSETDLRPIPAWTKMEHIDCYKKAIEAIEKKAEEEGLSLAVYELSTFSRR